MERHSKHVQTNERTTEDLQQQLERILAPCLLEPRVYQRRIMTKCLQLFDGTHRNRRGTLDSIASSVMIESPTGSGKTVMGLALARFIQQQLGMSVGWVSMRRNLLAQTARENSERQFGVRLELISMFDKSPPAVDLLIVDEAQHDAAASMANLHSEIRPQRILGLTATPYRTDRIRLCFDHVIRDAGIHRLIQDGYLSQFHHFTIPEYTPIEVARFFASERTRWGKTLIFFRTADECFECQFHLIEQGVRVEVVTATTDREAQIAAFERGELDVLINMNVLTEGFDCPSLQTVFCRPSSKGCTVQMAGRVLRLHPDLSHKQIVQCARTKHPFLKTATAAEQWIWMDGEWRSLTVNPKIQAISGQMRQLVSQSNVQLPSVVAQHRRRAMPWERDGDDDDDTRIR